ncbi:helix-turn-helix domain-containing protein [Larkinella soli]|uniref:helix-turn-helix domain-containing protein n=1 Tax=Larkinella soli TaxID=1770527 RepID=UPI000FFC583A|nr:helix-turn-helix transcriptional regulator [Larkinella soli]
MKNKNKSLKSLDELINEEYGPRGLEKREKFEEGYEAFRLGVLIHEARLEKGLTQEELARRCGTNKSFISKIENDAKDVKISTLRRIIENGLGGHLHLSIKF